MTEELKPCPFCGSREIEQITHDAGDIAGDFWFMESSITCLCCGASMCSESLSLDTDLQQICAGKWNRRQEVEGER